MNKPFASLAALTVLVVAHPVTAQDADWGWANSTEVGFVTTSGNSASTTLSLKASLTGTGGPNELKIGVGGIRASSEVTSRTAQGTPSNFTVTETTSTVESTANYYARARYDRELGRAFAFGGAGWERNTLAGVNHRYSTVAGFGRTWINNDSGRFKTDLGGTFTIQEDVESAGDSEGFGGLRMTVDVARTLTESADLETTFVLDENLDNTDDLRFDWLTSLSVALTEGLALKTSYQLVFDNEPALVRVPLFTGGTENGTVPIESDELDSFLTLSLVIEL